MARYIVGLTGGVASGKSALAREFVALGAAVADADIAAREVVAPGTPGLAEVVAAFGPGVLEGEGVLDRTAMLRHVFDDAGEGRELVKNAFHTNRRDGCTLDRGEQYAAKRVTDRGTKTTLERLGDETPVVRSESLRIVVQLLRLLKI